MVKQTSFKTRVKEIAITESKRYKEVFIDHQYLICSKDFHKKDYYILAAEKDNLSIKIGSILVDRCIPCCYNQIKVVKCQPNGGITVETIGLSNGEWKLMHVLWESAPCTITQLVELLRDDTGWGKHTIITMLTRLEKKGAVTHKEGGRAKLFYPAVERSDTQLQETRNFLSRLYGGSLEPMVSTMMQEESLSQKEIEELYTILKKAKEEQKDV